MSLNRVILIGRLTRDPELRSTTTGKNVANFGIAVDRRFKGQDGVDVDFFNVSAWGSTAEFCANYLGKGRLVAVDGRLQTRKYTTNEGVNREVTEIIADNVQGLDRPREDGEAPRAEAGGKPVPAEDEFDPFAED
ncbi:MAG: single-stranded DNA-binding protein [Fimbriimonadaceae bacterium]|nr:single-stranded DNA-binding protein [Fimbriimonadaceae bacterium]QYK56758.1 MAG: single-stranded DNA-binding protein [Fimbriimonadaceae bacterium]